MSRVAERLMEECTFLFRIMWCSLRSELDSRGEEWMLSMQAGPSESLKEFVHRVFQFT